MTTRNRRNRHHTPTTANNDHDSPDDPQGDDPQGDDPQGDDLQEEDPSISAPKMNLSQFVEKYKDSITKNITETYTPLYRPSENGQPLPELLREPMGKQDDAIQGAVISLQSNQGTTVVGEMGTGKTFIGAAAAHMAGFRRPLVLCPPHLVRKWKREVENTIPDVQAVIINSITDLKRLKLLDQSKSIFTIMSRERAKLSYRWKPAYTSVWAYDEYGKVYMDVETGLPYTNIACPTCRQTVLDKEGLPVSPKALETKRTFCKKCESALWQADRKGPKRYPLADYIKKYMKHQFDLFIADEVHEYKGKGSAQGIAAGVLAETCPKSLTLTGTMMGGYASTIFHLLYRFSPTIRTKYAHTDESRWIDHYGFLERTVMAPSEDIEHGRQSRRKGYKTVVREKPGITPAALFHIIGNTVFLRLNDVADALPPYQESIQLCKMNTTPDETGYSQATAYNHVYTQLKQAMSSELAKGSKRLLGMYLQTLLAYPDGCTKGETAIDPQTNEIIVHMDPLRADITYPKEQALLDLVKQEHRQGRRVLVYVTHTVSRDITARLTELLSRNNLNTQVLKADTVKPEQREAWVSDKVEKGTEVLICHPRLVQTGLDLIDFPTIVWYETDYSVYTMRQASRRSWRIGQNHPVKVIFMGYERTIHTDALKLIARKLQSSLAVEGELPDEGLSNYQNDQEDMILALAKRIANDSNDSDDPYNDTEDPYNESQDPEDVEAEFAKAREAETEALDLLVDDEWRIPSAPVEPDPAQQPLPQLQPAPAPHPATAAVQPTLLSWDDLLVLPEKPQRTRRKPKQDPSSQNLFDWAMGKDPTSQPGQSGPPSPP